MKPGDLVTHGSVMGRVEQVDSTPGRPDRVLVDWRRSWIDGCDLEVVADALGIEPSGRVTTTSGLATHAPTSGTHPMAEG